jgi:hypothetical protein
MGSFRSMMILVSLRGFLLGVLELMGSGLAFDN